MQITIISHNIFAGKAKIKFEHNNVVFVEEYDLKLFIPGTELALKKSNIEFTADMQNAVIDKIATQVEQEIDAGIIKNTI